MRGDRLSRDAVEHLVRKYTLAASKACASLIGKRVSPHVLRHSTAMDLLQNGVDRTVIALGSDMIRSRRRKSTCMPISVSKKKLWLD